MTRAQWQVVGFIALTAEAPVFLVPLLRQPGGNTTVLQRTDATDHIADFEPIEDIPEHLTTPVADGPRVGIGDPAVWGFRLKPGEHVLGPAAQVLAWLAERTDSTELRATPLVRLNVLQLLGRDDELVPALHAAYSAMKEISRGSADYWRDSVVLPELCRDILRANGIATDGVDTDVEGGILTLLLPEATQKAAEGIDWGKAFRPYLQAFGLALTIEAPPGPGAGPEYPAKAVVTAFQRRSARALNSLLRQRTLPQNVVAPVDPFWDEIETTGVQRVYVFVDGSEGLYARSLHDLRSRIAPIPIHLIWADFGQKLPTTEHEKAVDAITLLPARTQWPGEGTLDSPEALSTTELVGLFLHMAAANFFEHEPRGTFVATRPSPLRSAPDHQIGDQLWTSAINSFLPPWAASTLAFIGRPDHIPSAPPHFGFMRHTIHRGGGIIPMLFGTVVAHLYEGWSNETEVDLVTRGYAQAFQMMGWQTSSFRGDTWFEANSPATGRIRVTLVPETITVRNVADMIRGLAARWDRDTPHVIIPIGPRPTAGALAQMIEAGLHVILPHRLPLMAHPQNEWAYRYPPLSQLNGERLHMAVYLSLQNQIDDVIAANGFEERFPSYDWTVSTNKTHGGATILVQIELVNERFRREITLSLSSSGPDIHHSSFSEH